MSSLNFFYLFSFFLYFVNQLCPVISPVLDEPFESQNSRESHAFHFRIQLSEYTMVKILFYFKDDPEYLTRWDFSGLYPFEEIFATGHHFGMFSGYSDLLLSYFLLHHCLILSASNIFKYL